MNRQLRKRFLGAGVVVALAALVLPYLLQGEGYKANQRLAEAAKTQIPERPAAPIRLDTQVPPPPADVREALVEPEDLPEPALIAPAPPAKPAPAESVKPKPVPPTSATKPVKPESKPESSKAESGKQEIKPVTPQKSPAQPLPAQTPAAAKPAVKSAEIPPAPPASLAAGSAVKEAPAQQGASKEKWLIQLGSFTAEANAQKLLEQVQRGGISARVERIEIKGNTVWRVTSQTYASRAEADAALKTLQSRLNLGGMVKPAQ
ncbi:MAG: SPOR domain-containing protein [Pseudomonadota bacterium]